MEEKDRAPIDYEAMYGITYGIVNPAYDTVYMTPVVDSSGPLQQTSQSDNTNSLGRANSDHVVTQQPMHVSNKVTKAPPDYSCLACCSLFFCLAFGIIALMKVSQVEEAVSKNDLQSATVYAKQVKIFSILAIASGIVAVTVMLCVLLIHV